MTRILVATLTILALAVPVGASAAQFVAGEQYTLRANESALENLYVAAGGASVAGDVLGDLVLAGGQVTVTGDVLEDALILGGNVNMLGAVGDDLRIAGGQLVINSAVGGDLVIAGGRVNISADTAVSGDLYIAAGEVVLEGTVNGDVHVAGGRLTIIGTVLGNVNARVDDGLTVADGALIQGALNYRSRAEADISNTSRIIGGVTFDQIAKIVKATDDVGQKAGSAFAGIAALLLSWRILMLLGFSLLLALAWKEWSTKLVSSALGSFLRSFGIGLVMLIVMPVAIALLLMSFVGTLVGIFGIALYAGMIILAQAVTVLLTAALLARFLTKQKTWRLRWTWIILAVLVLQLLTFIPVLGWLAKTLLFMAAFGILARQAMDTLHVKV